MLRNKEPLVAVETTKKLLVEPIWENPIDDIEGPLYSEYIRNNPKYNQVYVRKSVAVMLKHAAKNMPSNYRLILRAGHRPIEVQYRLLEGVKAEYYAKNPLATEGQAFEFARTYVSDPAIKLPPHCCGAAVDVDVQIIETDELLDFGCPVNTDNEIAGLKTDKLTSKQKKNRSLLHKVMLGAGFAPFEYEWWHFSYGDKTWAEYYDDKIQYGLAEPKL